MSGLLRDLIIWFYCRRRVLMPNRYWQLDRFFSKQDVGAEEWLRDTGFILSSIDTVEDPYFCRIHLETNCKDVACQPA